MRSASNNLPIILSIFGLVLITESILWLDLVPILSMIRWPAILVGCVVLFAMVTCFFVWQHRRGYPFRFSTRTMMLLALVVAWPFARIVGDIRSEQRLAQSQRQCVEMVFKLMPGALRPGTTLVQMAGRYNDGRRDNPIYSSLVSILSLSILYLQGVNPNEVPYEICYFVIMDLTGSAIGDDELLVIANTQTVRELNLSSTQITDAGLKHLYALHTLRLLNLTGTSVSDSAINALEKALPNLVVQK